MDVTQLPGEGPGGTVRKVRRGIESVNFAAPREGKHGPPPRGWKCTRSS
jgi:hypothetical protein